MQNLSQNELRYLVKNRKTNGYKIMLKDKLIIIIIIIIIIERDRKSIFKSNKFLYKPTRNRLFKLKREKIKKSLYKPAKKNLFKSKIEEIKEIIHDIIMNRDEKIEEINKFFMIHKIIFLNQKESL